MLLISFLALFASIFFLQLGNSILAPFDVLVGLNVGFTNFQIGLLGSSHFLGFLTGCWIVPFIMARVGHIRAFTIFAMLSVFGSLLHPIFVDPYFWCVLRVLSGLSIAGCFTIAEGWLNAKVTNQNRGRVFGGYRFVDNGGAALGVVFISLLDVAVHSVFDFIIMGKTTVGGMLAKSETKIRGVYRFSIYSSQGENVIKLRILNIVKFSSDYHAHISGLQDF